MTSPTALVGRDDLVRRATAALDGGSGGVVLVGEGGVGKSRLASELVGLAKDRGYFAVSTVGTQAAAAIPLGALGHLLPDLSASNGNVLMAARAALAEQAGDRPLLVSVDDAHLLDDHSATLVLQLAMSMPSVVVATVRTGEPVPDAVLALWKEGIAERIEVGNLDDASIAALAGEVLGGPIDPPLAAAITSRAGGNALFARELSLSGRDAGAIAAIDGRWTLVGKLGVSARLVELVRARVDDLTPAERAAVDVIAHGEPIGQQLASDIVGEDALLALERRGLVVLRDDRRRQEVWLSHPMYAEVLRAMTRRMLASSIIGRLAAATTATGMRRRSDLLRVATWQLDAGDGDPDLLRRAATETRRAGDMGGTARLAAGAWDLRPDTDVAILLGTALGFSGRFEEADAIFAAAEELATDDPTLTRIAIVHVAILSAGLGQPQAAIALLTETEERVAGPAELAILRAQRAHLLALDGDVDASRALWEPIIANRPDETSFIGASMAAVITLQMAGAYARIGPIAEAAIPGARRLWGSGDVSIPPEMFELEAFGAQVRLGNLGDLPAAVLTSDTVRAGLRFENRPVAVLAALHTAAVHLRRGRPVSASRAIEAVGPQARDLLGAPAAAMQALSAALLGDGAAAAAHLARARAWRRAGSIYDPFADEAEAWTLVAGGQPEAGRRSAVASLEGALAAHRWGQAADLAHSLARIGGVETGHEAMERIGDRVDGPFAVANRAHVAALLADDADALEAVSKAYAGFGADLLAAESAAEAAQAARRQGDPRRATRLMRTANELAARCEGARTPALAFPDDDLSPLSRRELEVADLASTGLSSEEIAGRLFLSVRTVDNHLQHVYQKLGISSRQELAHVLGRRSVEV